MTEAAPFAPVKLVCGVICAADGLLHESERRLTALFGPVDLKSPAFPFDLTDYYEAQMGKELKRTFLSFSELIRPESLSGIKLLTNTLELDIGESSGRPGRIVNLDPGYITAAALIMATAKNFSHRVPLENGIYAHLEFLFSRAGIKALDWTYPDFRRRECQEFFREVRAVYLARIKNA
jgi:hypothetical protein